MADSDDSDPSTSNWRVIHEGEDAVTWADHQGQQVTIYVPEGYDYWKIVDSTDTISTGAGVGPFNSYQDALEYAHRFVPAIGAEEFPSPDGDPDEVVEVGSFSGKGMGQECAECGSDAFSPYRVEYGDGSTEWLCPPCAGDRFNLEEDEEPPLPETVTVQVWELPLHADYDEIDRDDPDHELELRPEEPWEYGEEYERTIAEETDTHQKYGFHVKDIETIGRPVTVNVYTNDSVHEPDDWTGPIENGLVFQPGETDEPFKTELWGRVKVRVGSD